MQMANEQLTHQIYSDSFAFSQSILTLSAYTMNDLFEAISKTNIEELNNILNVSPELLSVCDEQGITGLHIAAKTSQAVLEYLIKKGATIDVKDNAGRTILHHAAMSGQLDVVVWLIQNYPTLNPIRDHQGMSAFLYAASEGFIAIMEVLLRENQAKWNETDNNFRTAMHCALDHERYPVVFWLLEDHPELKVLEDRFLYAYYLNKQYQSILIKMLCNYPLPSSLNFSGLILSNHFNKEVLNVLVKNTTVKSLDFSHSYLNPILSELLCRLVSENTCLMQLNLSHNLRLAYYSPFIKNLSNVLASPKPVLAELNLSHMNLQTYHANYLAEALISNTHLRVLKLADNREINSLKSLLEAIEKNTTLEKIDIQNVDWWNNVSLQQEFDEKLKKRLQPQNTIPIPKSNTSANSSNTLQNNNAKPIEYTIHDLIRAAEGDDVERLRVILDHTPKLLNAHNDVRETALHGAAYSGASRAVTFLIAEKAKIDAKTDSKFTVLHYAAMGGHLEIVWLIAIQCPKLKRVKNNNGNNAFLMAAWNGHIAVMQALANTDSDWLKVNAQGQTALHLAIRNNRLQATEWLIHHHPELCGIRDKENNNAFFYAVEEGHTEIMQLVMEKETANWNEKGFWNWSSALHCALEKYSYRKKEWQIDVALWFLEECPKRVLDRLLKIEIFSYQSPYHDLPLFSYATVRRHIALMQSLYRHGVNWRAVDGSGNTALHLAVNRFYRKDRHRSQETEVLNFLISHCFELKDIKNNWGYTPFLHAISYDSESNAKFLVNHHAMRWDETNDRGQSALHLAAENRNADLVAWLIMQFPGLKDMKDRNGNGAFYSAVRESMDGHYDGEQWKWDKLYKESREIMRVLIDTKAASWDEIGKIYNLYEKDDRQKKVPLAFRKAINEFLDIYNFPPLLDLSNLNFKKCKDFLNVLLVKLQRKQITEINFSKSHLPESLGNALFYLVHRHSTLTDLNLSHNVNLGGGGIVFSSAIQTLAKGLASSGLVELNLENTQLNDQDAFALAEVLKSNTSLKRLILRHNKIGQRGALALLNALITNKTLEILDISDNPEVSAELLSAIQKQLMSTGLYHFSANLPLCNEALTEEENNTFTRWLSEGAQALGSTELHFKQVLVALLTPEQDEKILLECIFSTESPQQIEDLNLSSEGMSKLAYIIKNKEVYQFMTMQDVNPCGLNKALCLILILATIQGRLDIVRGILTRYLHTLADFQVEALFKTTLNSPRFWISRNTEMDLSAFGKFAPDGILPNIVALQEQMQKLEKMAPEYLSLRGTVMAEEELLLFFQHLQKVISLKRLDISHCRLQKGNAQRPFNENFIQKALKPLLETTELHELKLSNCDWSDAQLLSLIQSAKKGLGSWRSLKILDLSDNPKLTERSISQLYSIKTARPDLQIILTHNAQIGPRWHQKMASTLSATITQEELSWVDHCVEMRLTAESIIVEPADTAASSIPQQSEQTESIETPSTNDQEANVTFVEIPSYPAYALALAKIEQEMNDLRQQQSYDRVHLKQLEHKQKILQDLIHQIGEVEIQRDKLHHELSEQARVFYDRFYKRLADFFMACGVANSGRFLCDKKTILGKTGFVINLLGEVLPVAGMPAKVVGALMKFSDRFRETEKMAAITEWGDSAELRRAAHGLSALITARHGYQIAQFYTPEEEKQRDLERKTGSEGIKTQLKQKAKESKTQVGQALGAEPWHSLSEIEQLAEYGVAQLIDLLSNESLYLLPDVPLNEQLFSFWLRSRDPSLLNQVKESALNLVGTYSVKTRNGKTWQIQEVYNRPLVQIEDQLYRYLNRSVAESQKDYDNYGVVQGSP